MPALLAQNRKANAGRPAAWASDIADGSLSALWHPTNWDCVNEDELVFLLPSLALGGSGRSVAHEVNDFLVKILKARVIAVAQRMSSPAYDAALERLVSSGLLTQLAMSECESECEPAHPAARTATGDEPGEPAQLLTALIAIARIDRMIRDVRESSGQRLHGRSMIDWPLSFSEVVIATIHSRLNGAYVYKDYTYAHEMLTAAAVVGHLVHGRAVHIDRMVATCIIDALSAGANGAQDSPYEVLLYYADVACGRERLLATAKSALTGGGSALANPRTDFFNRGSTHASADARIAQRIRAAGLLHSCMVV